MGKGGEREGGGGVRGGKKWEVKREVKRGGRE